MITDKHKTFAQAVVALARQHQMNNITVSFIESYGVPGRSSEQVTMSWNMGRHGVKGSIELTTRATERVEEEIQKKPVIPKVYDISDWLYNSYMYVVRDPESGFWYSADAAHVPQDRQRMTYVETKPDIVFESKPDDGFLFIKENQNG